MKKLFAQIVKFGIVGVISFGIDYVTGLIVLNLVMALTSSSYFEAASPLVSWESWYELLCKRHVFGESPHPDGSGAASDGS